MRQEVRAVQYHSAVNNDRRPALSKPLIEKLASADLYKGLFDFSPSHDGHLMLMRLGLVAIDYLGSDLGLSLDGLFHCARIYGLKQGRFVLLGKVGRDPDVHIYLLDRMGLIVPFDDHS